MVRRSLYILALTAAVSIAPASAATVSVALKDSHGAPASDAVVTLTPASGNLAPRAPDEATIDQRHQMFMPLVVVVRRGGHVVFANNDGTMHQVYSFSPIKRFEQEIEKGKRSQPVVFDKAGIAAIGCNIHDNMIAYVFVTDAPLAAATDAKGAAGIADVPAGAYHVAIWHPRLGQSVTLDVTVTDAGASIVRSLPLAADKASNAHKQHMQSY